MDFRGLFNGCFNRNLKNLETFSTILYGTKRSFLISAQIAVRIVRYGSFQRAFLLPLRFPLEGVSMIRVFQ